MSGNAWRVLQIELSEPCTQAEFGQMVGITQQAVSDLMRRGILLPDQSAQTWLDRYLTHLRLVIIDRLSGRL